MTGIQHFKIEKIVKRRTTFSKSTHNLLLTGTYLKKRKPERHFKDVSVYRLMSMAKVSSANVIDPRCMKYYTSNAAKEIIPRITDTFTKLLD